MKLQDFDYDLPKELIAQEPLPERDGSRLMVLHRENQKIEHTYFNRITDYLQRGDLFTANNTRVIAARIFGKKETGGWVELFLLNFIKTEKDGSQVWECLLSSRRKISVSSTLSFKHGLTGEVLGNTATGTFLIRLSCSGDFDGIIRKAGMTPLPPYIKRAQNNPEDSTDRERYQTVYAVHDGAVAAPTAGFHFTEPLIEKIKEMGADFVFVTLHVGFGTFQPIREEIIEKHSMHNEFYQVSEPAAEKINTAKKDKRRIIAVGTTSTRVLETVSDDNGVVHSCSGTTDCYIYPGYCFKAVDALITNFHLPKSSLILLVSAFAGKDFIFRAYREAIEQKYRFFSYGDAMLIL